MDTATYKRCVNKTLTANAKPAKTGLRALARKVPTTNLSYGLVGFADAMGEVREVLHDYILGFQFDTGLRPALREKLGEAIFALTIASKTLKIRVPANKRMLKVVGMTNTAALLRLDKISTQMLAAFKVAYQGMDFDTEALKALVNEAWPLLYGLCGSMADATPAQVMGVNIAAMAERMEAGTFNVELLRNRDKDAELDDVREAFQRQIKATEPTIPA
ncbi:hypothetical protein WK13_34420 [Burkholderia ubonensis]|uniref:hypothetical protein n=1 Tax=Burkholderia ubonensis TaxID=101571 RepID=UPI00076BCAFB|nr:hypothetical protein [Burkholderia ubonensis]KVR21635.1 hypothetical protein WK13_34420 [Burkholderia ubonensis]